MYGKGGEGRRESRTKDLVLGMYGEQDDNNIDEHSQQQNPWSLSLFGLEEAWQVAHRPGKRERSQAQYYLMSRNLVPLENSFTLLGCITEDGG